MTTYYLALTEDLYLEEKSRSEVEEDRWSAVASSGLQWPAGACSVLDSPAVQCSVVSCSAV